MLQFAYILSSIGVLLVIATKPRPVSASSLFGLGTLLYGLPLLFGHTEFITTFVNGERRYSADLEDLVYVIFLLCHAAFYVSSWLNDKEPREPDDPGPLWLQALMITLGVSIVAFLLTSDVKQMFVLSKGERMQNITVFYEFASNLTVCAGIYQIVYGDRSTLKFMILPAAFVALDVVLGYRTTLFLGSASLALAYYQSKPGALPLKERLRVGAIGAGVVLMAFVYKPIYFAMEAGREFRFADLPGYFEFDKSVSGSEPFVVTGVLNEVVRHGVDLPAHYFATSILQYFPFFETFFGQRRISFNEYVQPSLFPETEWGLGSTSLGELYCVGGVVAIIAFLALLVAFMRMRIPRNPYLVMCYYFMAPHCLVYVYRNDWHLWIGTLRLLMMSSLGVGFVHMMLKMVAQGARGKPLGAPAEEEDDPSETQTEGDEATELEELPDLAEST